MGIDNNADLGYGFIIPEDFFDKVQETIYKNKKFDLIFHGSAYVGDMVNIVCITESSFSSYAGCELPKINSNKLIVKDEWDTLLLALAKEVGFDKPKINWYLCSSIT